MAIQRWPGRITALAREDGVLVVRDLAKEPIEEIARFPLPATEWARGVTAVSPDARIAVFPGTGSLLAVDSAGETLWEHTHQSWEEPSTGSCAFTGGGTQLWATVPGHFEGDTYSGDEWLVLEALTGKVLARTFLNCSALGSEHMPYSDGVHMGLSVGEGQDGAPLYWGRLDGDSITFWDVGDDDRVLLDVHPEGDGYLTVAHFQEDAAWHDFPSGEDKEAVEAPLGVSSESECWDFAGGYVDARTVLLSTTEFEETEEDGRHWLVDVADGSIRGEVEYPRPVTGYAQPLGDGTWLTTDEDGHTCRWSL
jgi:hypothetical protein